MLESEICHLIVFLQLPTKFKFYAAIGKKLKISGRFGKNRGVVSVGAVGAWAPTDFWELLKGTPWAPTDVFGSKTIGHPQIEIPDYATACHINLKFSN